MSTLIERHYRLPEVSKFTGYSIPTLRRMVHTRALGHRKIGRIVAVPRSEVERLLGEYRQPLVAEEVTR